ncbi:TPA: type IV secretion system protein [Proteus mirabilis]|nr:type IV secretion system protein [Proteus mirabilis]
MADVPSYTSDFFKTAHRLIDQVLDTATKGKLAEYSGIAVDLVQAGVVIWMIIYAFQTIAGKQKTPVADFLWQMGKMAIILVFVKNTGGWMDAANNEINALKTTLAGGA